MRYILGIDQSTQGTKAILLDDAGKRICRTDLPHRQIVNELGWVSHDPMEIYENTIAAVKALVEKAGVEKSEIQAVGLTNQRETTVYWDRSGCPLADAVVWQCARAKEYISRYADQAEEIFQKTGLPLSPYFPAVKMAWLKEHTDISKEQQARSCFGTIDSWLIYKLTGGASFKTDYSNASRTQLFNLHTLSWDEELCDLFGISIGTLPEVCDSNACFGYTDFEGFLEQPIPIYGVMGDSHAALYGQGCHTAGMVKTTYGTGSSIMMNIGKECIRSKHGLATSVAWGMDGSVEYVLEGNINYTGAVITWLKEDLELIHSPSEAEAIARQANPHDTTVLVPAFTGLSAPYWRDDTQALIYGMSRTTKRAEIVKAALESIAFQITDVLEAMKQDSKTEITELRADGGPTANGYLMQFQSDLAKVSVLTADNAELSAIGVSYMAGLAAGLYEKEKLAGNVQYKAYKGTMPEPEREQRYGRWKKAVALTIGAEA